MILRLLNGQGIAGIAVSLALTVLLVMQKGETRHWKKQSDGFEQLYNQERADFTGTVATYRAAAERARSADQANASRIAAEQRAINERTANDYEPRLAVARAAAQRLRLSAQTAADPGACGGASVPRLPAAADGIAQAAGQDRLSQADALIATEQGIQLDELIKWVRAQAKVDNNPAPVASPSRD
jgi:hypothetical protein